MGITIPMASISNDAINAVIDTEASDRFRIQDSALSVAETEDEEDEVDVGIARPPTPPLARATSIFPHPPLEQASISNVAINAIIDTEASDRFRIQDSALSFLDRYVLGKLCSVARIRTQRWARRRFKRLQGQFKNGHMLASLFAEERQCRGYISGNWSDAQQEIRVLCRQDFSARGLDCGRCTVHGKVRKLVYLHRVVHPDVTDFACIPGHQCKTWFH
jgi:hypothetical protein